jgi:hypothetical protein
LSTGRAATERTISSFAEFDLELPVLDEAIDGEQPGVVGLAATNSA